MLFIFDFKMRFNRYNDNKLGLYIKYIVKFFVQNYSVYVVYYDCCLGEVLNIYIYFVDY